MQMEGQQGTQLRYEYITRAEDLGRIAEEISQSSAIGFDLETARLPLPTGDALDPRLGRPRLISINTGRNVYVIDVFQTGTPQPIIDVLSNPLAETGKGRPLIVGQGLKFDLKYMVHHYGCWLYPIFDTYKASNLIYNGKIGRNEGGFNLYSIYQREMPEQRMLMKEGDWGASDWSVLALSREQLDYAAEDVTYMVPRLYRQLRERLEALGLLGVALIEFRATWAEAEMELNGLPFNKEDWLALYESNLTLQKQMYTALSHKLPHPYGQRALPGFDTSWNLDSNPQLQASLKRLGINVESTDEETLAMLAGEAPILRDIIGYRKIQKSVGTYGDDFLRYVHPVTNRIHTDYYSFTGAGRYACIPTRARVSTSGGVIPIGEIEVGDLIQTAEGPRKVLARSPITKKPVLRIHTERNKILECTAEHRVFANGQWVEAGSLKKGDYVYQCGVEGPATATLVPDNARDLALAELAGYWQGGRHSEYGRIGFCSRGAEPEYLKRIEALLKKAAPSARLDRKLSYTTWLTVSTEDSDFWYRWQHFVGAQAEVPEVIWRGTREAQKAFLRGVLESAAWPRRRGGPSMCSTHVEWLQQIELLLSRFGVFTRWEGRDTTPVRGKDSYVLRVAAQSLETLAALQVYTYPRQQLLEVSVLRQEDSRKNPHTGIQKPAWLDLSYAASVRAYAHMGEHGLHPAVLWKWVNQNKGLSHFALRTLAQADVDGANPSAEFITWAARSNARSLQVERIEVLPEEPVIDITVEGTESFLLNGFHVHNCSNPNCFDGETEVLTPEGWVAFAALDFESPSLQVAQWATDGSVSFVAPTGFIKERLDTPLYRLTNTQIDLKVTDDHRCLLRHRKTGALRVFRGADYPDDWLQIQTGNLVPLPWSQSVPLPSVDLVRLLVAVQADGHLADNGVNFTLVKPRKIFRFRSLCERAGVSFTEHPKARGGNPTYAVRFRIRASNALMEHIRVLLGDQKTFGPWLLQLPTEHREAFISELMEWDGSHTRRNNYASIDPLNTTWVQTLVALSGQRAHWRVYHSTKPDGTRGNASYQVDISDREGSLTTNIERTRQPASDGFVYCVSVPSSYLLVRSGRKIHVTGNCQNIPRDPRYRACFQAPKGWKLLLCDYGQIELRLIAEIANEHVMRTAFLQGKDPHAMTAELVVGKKLSELSKEEAKNARQLAKAINFGLMYGLGWLKFIVYAMKNYTVSLTPKEARLFHGNYFAAYPGIPLWHRERIREDKSRRQSWTRSGRIRYLTDKAHNEYYNTPIQGTGADGLKNSLWLLHHRLRKYGDDAMMIHMVHDEVILQVRDDQELLTAVGKELEEGMIEGMSPYIKTIPIEAVSSYGDNWASAKH